MQRYTGPPSKTPRSYRKVAPDIRCPHGCPWQSICWASILVSLATLLFTYAPCFAAEAANSNVRWKINSVKICKTKSGTIFPSIEAIGQFPVYSFFIPRPVWTVNGNVVEAKPNYAQGRLVAFELMNAGAYLEHGKKNIIKFALPDHNGSRIFLFDHSRIPPGECYEFF